ncbi:MULTISPECIES: cell division protein ZapA [Desulfovibrio]|uniref:Cell division protein ZapA n=3 Tax=Desulfovibrio TaxID=872 RepID=A0AA94L2F7_DESDE|nr:MULTISPECIES: cell division protein ZapA [Desulfovibrio]ATD80720.1 cell division protein ZapA [Desulfovibrio sp. G11]MDY0203318.1 cell division protein ZapA [Desulfovibrio desulfuricans]SFW52239.1 cell division protein ZapA [Desulfovibrio desulfuricans]SPD36245.1 Cell division protein ZapA [Desulfovibrio sp. G11]
MNQEAINLTVLGLSIAFKPGADMDRVQEAVRLVEERFTDQKLRFHGGQTKDILLTFMALGLADDLLQSQKELAGVQDRVTAMLSKIEGSV